ncbi:RICIN domain-containing protein [Kitasatospora sp. NPDC001261]|uniref:RICIN domain-containing protein n=1 Tax=Kitasatospora sp. NPDC001261 TaxID=3364012 RepID=UPI00368459E8
MDIKPGTYSIKCVGYLTQVATAPASGDRVVGQKERELDTQYWEVEENGQYNTIRNVGTGRYLAVDGDSAVLGENPEDWDVTLENQGRFKVAAVGDGRALYLTGGKDGSPVELANYTGAKPQQWYFQSRDDD